MKTDATKKVARFIAETSFDAIPPEAARFAKDAILDCLGVTIAGANEPGVRILGERVKGWGAMGEAGVIGSAIRTTTDLAAWINGCASHALDYDDTFSSAAGFNFHPSVPVLPAVLALGEKMNASGKEVLTAYIVGIEIESRVGAAIGRSLAQMGWHSTPVIGTLGAAAASANLLKLDCAQAQMALGIAASFSGGILQNFGTMTKPLHAGNAARNGVTAALLAQQGFTADADVLEGEQGFCAAYSGNTVRTIAPHERDLGSVWHIIAPGISLKAYPCCRSTHSSIDAAIQLRDIAGIDPGEVVKIICKIGAKHTKLARFHKPRTAYEAKFSIPYCIAVALQRGGVLLSDFTEEKVASAQAQALLSTVDFLHPQEPVNEPMGLSVELVATLATGKEYSAKISVPKGDAQNPMTREERSAKFADCTHSFLAPAAIDRAGAMIDQMESQQTIAPLISIVTRPVAKQKAV